MVAKSKKRTPNKPHNLVVIELAGEKRRIAGKPHLYVLRTQRSPDAIFHEMVQGKGPKWIVGTAKTLRSDLVPNYKPTLKRDVAEERLKKIKLELARKGFAINGDTSTWRVYVLDVDSCPPPKKCQKPGRCVYVGQTSATLQHRLAQHNGETRSKSGKYIGAPSIKGCSVKLNQRLTPSKILFTLDDAQLFETEIHLKLKRKKYDVRGDIRTD
jgi:hypothetical protein